MSLLGRALTDTSSGTWLVSALAHQPHFGPNSQLSTLPSSLDAISADCGRELEANSTKFPRSWPSWGRTRPISGELGQFPATSADAMRIRPMRGRFRPISVPDLGRKGPVSRAIATKVGPLLVSLARRTVLFAGPVLSCQVHTKPLFRPTWGRHRPLCFPPHHHVGSNLPLFCQPPACRGRQVASHMQTATALWRPEATSPAPTRKNPGGAGAGPPAERQAPGIAASATP